VLYVGRVHPEKGLELLIGAFRQVAASRPGVQLTIVGPVAHAEGGGGDPYLARLRALASGLPVSFQTALRDEAAVAERLREAGVFCYPSVAERGETFGRALLEAMASGLACVASDLPCFTELLQDGRCGLSFDHRAPDAEARLAACLGEALSRRGEALGAAARQRAADFSLEALTHDYEAFFEEVRARA
jgi:glycosyltransferase involved in cell wall biosynthesis